MLRGSTHLYDQKEPMKSGWLAVIPPPQLHVDLNGLSSRALVHFNLTVRTGSQVLAYRPKCWRLARDPAAQRSWQSSAGEASGTDTGCILCKYCTYTHTAKHTACLINIHTYYIHTVTYALHTLHIARVRIKRECIINTHVHIYMYMKNRYRIAAYVLNT